ncbi:MAG TPA: ABC transporter substrate-binding protein [Candidatus Acidoferrum sp.]|nr:ABC transporter substrate-binding protein [Candidatus Acidoferrum sp.]
MKVRLSLFLAASSVVLAALPAFTARLPRYGGTLVMDVGATVNSIDPSVAQANSDDGDTKEQIDGLLYAQKNADGTFAGAGPFRIQSFTPDRKALLVADGQFEGGRPFLDAIQIEMGRSLQDRLIDLQLGKADLAEIPADQARQAAERGIRVSRSRPDELIALVFNSKRSRANDPRIRKAIALSVDRDAIVNFILQKTGEPAGGLLPQWSSGTAFLFSTAADPVQAKQLWSQLAAPPTITVGYDANDSLTRSIAERIEVNAQGTGISMTAQSLPNAAALSVDARVMRLRMPSPVPQVALARFIDALNPLAGLTVSGTALGDPADPQQVYNTESTIIGTYSVVPIAWLPRVFGLSDRVRDWSTPGPGDDWPLANVWLDNIDVQSKKGTS